MLLPTPGHSPSMHPSSLPAQSMNPAGKMNLSMILNPSPAPDAGDALMIMEPTTLTASWQPAPPHKLPPMRAGPLTPPLSYYDICQGVGSIEMMRDPEARSQQQHRYGAPLSPVERWGYAPSPRREGTGGEAANRTPHNLPRVGGPREHCAGADVEYWGARRRPTQETAEEMDLDPPEAYSTSEPDRDLRRGSIQLCDIRHQRRNKQQRRGSAPHSSMRRSPNHKTAADSRSPTALTLYSASPSSPGAPKGPYCNKAYLREQVDWIRYMKEDCHVCYNAMCAEFDKLWPAERKTAQCFSARLYRDNKIPRLDAQRRPMFDENGKLLLDDAKVRGRATIEGRVKGVPFTLVDKYPWRAVEYPWVSEEHKELARRILQGNDPTDPAGSEYSQSPPFSSPSR